MPRRSGRPAAFLDRDGTIIVEREYLADPDGVELLPGAADALRGLRDAGYALVLVTNQSGIARGYFTEEAFHAVQRRLEAMLEREEVRLDGVYHCPHHPDLTGACDCRKPALGLYRRAADALGLDLGGSVYVGDKRSDVLPALELGGRGVLVRTGHGRVHETDLPDGIEVADDLAEAVRRITASDPRAA